MGFWEVSLYGNDCASDVRDIYMNYLEQGEKSKKAYKKTIEICQEYIGTDEEPLVWYALADTQWEVGELFSDVRENALLWIDRYGGSIFFKENKLMLEQWEKVLEDLKGKLNRDTPTKKVFKQRQVNRNPWNIGDVYAYRFHSEESKKMGLYGKYIPIQKVEDVEWYNGWIFSKIQFFDKVFDTVPKIKDIEGIRILPFDTGDRFSDGTPKELTLGVVMNIIMTIHFPKEYKKEYFTFIGNKVNEHSQFCDSVNCIEYNWICLEEILCPAYKYWQDYTVVTEEGKLVPNKLK